MDQTILPYVYPVSPDLAVHNRLTGKFGVIGRDLGEDSNLCSYPLAESDYSVRGDVPGLSSDP